MPDRVENQRIICQGGLFSNENHLMLSQEFPGAASRLVNFEVSLFGGYRRIEGFRPYDPAFPEVGAAVAEGPVLGVCVFEDFATKQHYIIAQRKLIGEDTYGFFKHVAGTGWVPMTLPTPRALSGVGGAPVVTRVRHAHYNFGAGNRIVFVDGVNPALLWDGTDFYELLSTNAGGTEAPGGEMVVDAPAVVEVVNNHIFLGGDEAFPSTVAYSAPSNCCTWTAAAGAGQLSVGFSVRQLKMFREDLFIFGRSAISKASPDVQAGWVIKPVTSAIGCIARDSVMEIGGDLLFLAPDGLRPVAGTSRIGDVELETVSKPVQRLVSNLAFVFDLDTLVSVVIRAKSQFRLFLGDDSTPTPDSYGIIGGLRTANQQLGWEFGELLGIRANCATSEYIGREEYVLHGDYNGRVYRQEQGVDFDGEDIIAIYNTPYVDFGDTEVRKTLHKVNIFMRAEGNFDLHMALTYNWGAHDVLNPASYTEHGEGFPVYYKDIKSIFGNSNVLYGGPTKPILSQRVEGSGHSVRCSFVSVGKHEPYSIQGLVFEFGQAGRRP